MEILINQRINFARISLFQNYSNLNDHRNGLIKPISNMNDELQEMFPNLSRNSSSNQFILPGTNIPKKNTKFFYSGEHNDIIVNFFHPRRNFGKEFITLKDRSIKRHFNNPFANITIQTIERSVKLDGDKLTLKIYRHNKFRQVNDKFFRKHTNVESLIFNLKTGNFLTIETDLKRRKQNKKRIRQNNFKSLIEFSKSFLNIQATPNEQFNEKITKIFNNDLIYDEISKFLKIDEPSKYVMKDVELLFRIILDNFIEKKKIKVPNDYVNYFLNYYPTEKFLKKNERKLIASILDMFNLNSKLNIKILHKNPELNLVLFCELCYILGDNYQKHLVKIKDFNFLKKRLNFNEITSFRNLHIFENTKFGVEVFKNNIDFNLLDIEKENLIKIINSSIHDEPFNLNENFNNLIDHFRMADKIRKYFDPTVHMRAKNMTDFNREHMEFSKLSMLIGKGYSIELEYDSELIEKIEKTIKNSNGDLFEPYILKREEEFIEEGKYMHHCVATYSERTDSIIISIRKGKDRVTCQYNNITGNKVQARYFCNEEPPKEFNNIIDIVDSEVKKLAKMNKLKFKKMNKIKLNIINGPVPENQQTIDFF